MIKRTMPLPEKKNCGELFLSGAKCKRKDNWQHKT